MTRGRKSDYEAYKAQYKKLKQDMKKQGFTMAQRMYRKREWEVYHKALTNDRKIEIAQGKRKLVGNVNRDLAKKQQWSLSSKQARAHQIAIKTQTGKAPKIKEIRSGKVSINWDLISQREQELRNQGWGWAKIHTQIAEDFFGS